MKSADNKSLWSKNFTIITLGSMVSKLGNALSGFAIGLLVLDYTKSTFLYALYMVMYNLPKIIVPALAGPWVDRYSRRKTIYTLDFISAAVFLMFTLVMYSGWFNYGFLLAGCILLGCIDSVYNVAYESLYPLLISEGNYTKAYSISSTLETLTTVMIPVSAFLYNLVGIGPLFLLDGISFLAAAVFETRIRVKEDQIERGSLANMQQFREDFKEGISYLRGEPGLLVITVYFMVTMFADGSFGTIGLPWFKSNYSNGEYLYIGVMAFMVLGRFIGGAIHYKFRYPTRHKFSISWFVYTVISVIGMVLFYVPVKGMCVLSFLMGILGVTSYNIRISGTQSYVPNEKKGRFTGIFNMLVTLGMLLGQFLAGVLANVIEERLVMVVFYGINLIAVFLIMAKNRKHVKPIYNVQA